MAFTYKSKKSSYQSDLGLDELPSATEEFLGFPAWVRLAYLARCARRVQPLFHMFWQGASQSQVQAIENALSFAERIASDPVIIHERASFKYMKELYAESTALTWEVMHIENAAREYWAKEAEGSPSFFSARSACCTVGCASATVEIIIAWHSAKRSDEAQYMHKANRTEGRARQTAKEAVETAYIAVRSVYNAHEMYEMMWRDFEIATQLARAVQHDPRSSVSPRLFGDLWPVELMMIPDWWPGEADIKNKWLF